MTGDNMSDPLEVACPYCGESLIESQITPVGVVPNLKEMTRDKFYFKHSGNKDRPCPVYDAVLALGFKA